MQVDDLRMKWNSHRSRSPIHAARTFDGDQLLLGARTERPSDDYPRNQINITSTVHWPGRPNYTAGDASPDPIEPGQQYAVDTVKEGPYNGDPEVERAEQALMLILNAVAASIPTGKGSLYGTMLHFAFATAVKAANLPGIGAEGVEQSFSAGDIVKYGADGSFRTDISLWNGARTRVIAKFDLKTGSAKLTDARIQQLRDAVRSKDAPIDGDDIPIIELRVDFKKLSYIGSTQAISPRRGHPFKTIAGRW